MTVPPKVPQVLNGGGGGGGAFLKFLRNSLTKVVNDSPS